MPLLHKFQEHNFQNGFQTKDSILRTVHYDPEVIFIGTYNHGWSWNQSDFYYGRNMFMWTVLANLFLHNHNHHSSPRNEGNEEPTFNQLFEICKKGKLIFADIVKGINENIIAIEQNEQQNVLVNNQYLWSTYQDRPLDYMASEGWLDDNVEAIIKYINATASIKDIYFTFKTGAWLVNKLNKICNGVRHGVTYGSIFTPTANGFGKPLLPPFHEKAWGLAHCWVWNGINHSIPVDKPNYVNLDHHWLIEKGVTPANF